MKRFIKRLLLFLGAVLILYPLMIWVIGSVFHKGTSTITTKFGHQSIYKNKLSEIENYGQVDLLIIGSSHAYRGFDTRNFKKIGLKTYNLGTSAQSPLQSAYLLRKYLDIFKPKYVIWEMYPRMFCVDGVSAGIIHLLNDSITPSMIFSSLKTKNIQYINTAIYNYVDQKINGLETTFNKITYPQIAGGYFEHIDTTVSKYQRSVHNLEINNHQMDAFKEGVEEIKKYNAQVILVEAPLTKYYYSKIENYVAFAENFKSFKNYYRYNNMEELYDSIHFYDSHHLNYKGVKLFNNRLIIDLQKDSIFK